MTNYRLLNDGEVIEDGDEFYDTEQWSKTDKIGLKQGFDKRLRRRPISVGTWIPTKERLPDPSPKRRVLIQEHNGERYSIDAYSVTTGHHIAWQELPEQYVAPESPKLDNCTLYSSYHDAANNEGIEALFIDGHWKITAFSKGTGCRRSVEVCYE